MQVRRYIRAALADPRLAGGPEPRVRRAAEIFPPARLTIPRLAFGDTDLTGAWIAEHPGAGAWRDTRAEAPAAGAYLMRDALVYGPYGIVTVGEFVIEETLSQVPLDDYGASADGATLDLPAGAESGGFPFAFHAMGPGYANQFHWLLGTVARLQMQPFAEHRMEGAVLLSPVGTLPQRDILMLLGASGRSLCLHGHRTGLRVGELVYLPDVTAAGTAPHPALAPFFDTLRGLLGADTPPSGRLYVSRQDSPHRRLANEDAVIRLVRGYGFEPVTLAGTDLASQARRFAAATHIVGPHGAGLANLVFCHPGVALCELHMDRHVDWRIRRLAGLRDARYGCIIGAAEGQAGPGAPVSDLRWTLPLDRLESVLRDPRFLPPPSPPSSSAPTAARPPERGSRLGRLFHG